jgi:hypothetical protein
MLTTWGRLSADRSLRVAAEFLEGQRPPGCVAESVLARVPDENVTGSWKMLLMDDAFTLLRRATDLLPEDARAENGVTVDDVRDDQRHQEWELVLDLLMEIADEQPVSLRFWSLLEDAARQMMLEHSADWCEWRAWEISAQSSTRITRSVSQLLSPEARMIRNRRVAPLPTVSFPR